MLDDMDLLPVSYTHLDVYKRQPYKELPVKRVNPTNQTKNNNLNITLDIACLLYTSYKNQ